MWDTFHVSGASRLESVACNIVTAARKGDSKLARASVGPPLGGLFFADPMPLPYHPRQGEILVCDFDDSAIGAEMVKRRPAVVVSRKDAHSGSLCTVVPLSTTAPKLPQAWHHPLPHVRVTGWQANGVMWAKCDMLATVSFDRLNKPYVRTRTGRNYITHALDPADLAAVLAGIRSYLGL